MTTTHPPSTRRARLIAAVVIAVFIMADVHLLLTWGRA